MLNGLAMDTDLTLTMILRHAQKLHHRREIVSVLADGSMHRYTYGDAFKRVAQLAHALNALGVGLSDRIGTFANNDYRHFELYFATACSGAVCHTVNPRLFDEQLEYIVNHAEDRWLFVDPTFVPLLEKLQQRMPSVEGFVIMCEEADMPQTQLRNVHCYETLIASESTAYEWPALDEKLACGICYTSGTTGNPKGVVYSHRSTTLMAFACAYSGAWHLQERDVILTSVPMYHANAWNLPYAGAMVGAKMILPGPRLGNGESDQALIETEGVTIAGGVPTVAQSLLSYLRESGKSVTSLERLVIGGSACAQSMMEEFERDHGVYIHHAWGMTELNPLGSVNHLMPELEGRNDEHTWHIRRKVGRPTFGVDIKIVDAEDKELPWDGETVGLLKVRGPWVCGEYFKVGKTPSNGTDGWFDTGDMATIDENGYFQITDRVKDVIKSGGEWISSIEIENIANSHPAIRESAVIGVTHPKWGERPLLCVVPESQQQLDVEEVLGFFVDKVAKWWIPDDCIFLHKLPYTATGKISKKDLRADFANHEFR